MIQLVGLREDIITSVGDERKKALQREDIVQASGTSIVDRNISSCKMLKANDIAQRKADSNWSKMWRVLPKLFIDITTDDGLFICGNAYHLFVEVRIKLLSKIWVGDARASKNLELLGKCSERASLFNECLYHIILMIVDIVSSRSQ